METLDGLQNYATLSSPRPRVGKMGGLLDELLKVRCRTTHGGHVMGSGSPPNALRIRGRGGERGEEIRLDGKGCAGSHDGVLKMLLSVVYGLLPFMYGSAATYPRGTSFLMQVAEITILTPAGGRILPDIECVQRGDDGPLLNEELKAKASAFCASVDLIAASFRHLEGEEETDAAPC